MKPAPAISTLAIAALAGNAAFSASAILRGFWRVAFARRMAIWLAKSPGGASRVRSISMAMPRSAAGTSDSGNAASACRSNVSIKFFKAILTLLREQRVGSLIDFEGIHIDRPTQTRRSGQRLDQRQP